jgi:hypothetical protein
MPATAIMYNLPYEYRKPKEDVYAIALNRTHHSRYKHYWNSHTSHRNNLSYRYERAQRVRQIFEERRSKNQKEFLKELYENINRWKSDTIHWSSMTEMLAHPSYLQIVGMAGRLSKVEVARALLQELQAQPDYWFDALAAITGEDPVLEDHDFDEAVNAWLAWGRNKGMI